MLLLVLDQPLLGSEDDKEKSFEQNLSVDQNIFSLPICTMGTRTGALAVSH